MKFTITIVLFCVIITILQFSCQKPLTDNLTPSTSTLDTLEHGSLIFNCTSNDPNIVGVAVIEYQGKVLKGRRLNSIITGRLFSFNKVKADNFIDPLNSTVRDFKNKSSVLASYKLLSDVFEDRFKKTDGFLKSYTLTEQQVNSLINIQNIRLGYNQNQRSEYQYASIGSGLIELLDTKKFFGKMADADWAVGGFVAATRAIAWYFKQQGTTALTGVTVGELVGAGTAVEISVTILPLAAGAFAAGYYSSSLFLRELLPKYWNTLNNDPNYTYDDFWLDVRDWFDKYSPFSNSANSWGDPHINTFDGLSYDFQAWGEFVAVKSTVDNFEVQVRQVGIENAPVVSFNRGLAVQTGSDVVCFVDDKLYINNQLQTQNFANLALRDNASLSITKDSRNIESLNIKSKYGDIVTIPKYSYDYKIQLSDSRKNKIVGLFGNYDGIKENELTLKNGTLITLESTKTIGISVEVPFKQMYPTYADSWRIEQKNSLFYYASGKNTETYTQKDYPKESFSLTTENRLWAEGVCKNAGVNKEPFLSACIMDVALTKDVTLASSSLWSQQNQVNSDILQVSTSSSTKPIDGRWEYYSNNNGGCTDLITTIVNLKDGLGIIEKVPITPYAFAVGDTLFKGIYFKSDNVYTTNFALAKSIGGAKSYYKADITLKTNGEILMTYIGVCNPSQNWRKK